MACLLYGLIIMLNFMWPQWFRSLSRKSGEYRSKKKTQKFVRTARLPNRRLAFGNACNNAIYGIAAKPTLNVLGESGIVHSFAYKKPGDNFNNRDHFHLPHPCYIWVHIVCFVLSIGFVLSFAFTQFVIFKYWQIQIAHAHLRLTDDLWYMI